MSTIFEELENLKPEEVGTHNQLTKDEGEFCEVDIDGGSSIKAKKINVGAIGEKTKLSEIGRAHV